MFEKEKEIVGRYIVDENKIAAQARNFMNFPQPQRQNALKDPMGVPMMPDKATGRVACFADVKTGRIFRLRYDASMVAPRLEDGKEYKVRYKGKNLISVDPSGY